MFTLGYSYYYYLKGLKGDMQCINFNALLHAVWFIHNHGSSTKKVSTEDSLCSGKFHECTYTELDNESIKMFDKLVVDISYKLN